jgi:hypothetical protein
VVPARPRRKRRNAQSLHPDAKLHTYSRRNNDSEGNSVAARDLSTPASPLRAKLNQRTLADISLLNLAGGSGTAISGPHKRGTGRTKAGPPAPRNASFIGLHRLGCDLEGSDVTRSHMVHNYPGRLYDSETQRWYKEVYCGRHCAGVQGLSGLRC